MFLPRPSRYVVACFAFFVILAVLYLSGATDSIDIGILRYAGTTRSDGLTRFMQGVSNIGDWEWEVPLMLMVGFALRHRGRASNALWYLIVCISAELLNAVLKVVFHRARPTVISHLGLAGSFSFPSGHTLLAPVIWGLGLILLSQLLRTKPLRIAMWVTGIGLSALIGISRVYLGVHYATDVLGGAFFGVGWVLWWWERVNPEPSVDPQKA
jgi:undecaprenyl-diphosphatase